MTLVIVYIIVLVILICLSFVFSSSDMAYGSVNVSRLEELQREKPKKKSVRRAVKLSTDYNKTISTILLLNDTVNAGMDSVATLLGVTIATQILGYDAQTAETWGLVASMIVLVVKIGFGEIIAKSFGKILNQKMTVAYATVLNALSYIVYPITFLVSGFGSLATKPIIKNVDDIRISEDDLHEMVDDIAEQGVIDEENEQILHETIRYTHTEAYEIMTPRIEVKAIDIDDPIEDIVNDPETYKYSRVPVYKDTIDNIIGYVRTRKLMMNKVSGKETILEDILETPLKYPRSAEINDIMSDFKREKKHFAVIMDEYGGVEGILTMEDILEEIVGEIWDEKDSKEIPYTQKKDGSYIVDGSLTLEDYCDLFDVDFDNLDTEYVTIGGYIIELLDDHFARVGDVIDMDGLEITVIAVDKNDTVEKIEVEDKREQDPREKRIQERIEKIDARMDRIVKDKDKEKDEDKE